MLALMLAAAMWQVGAPPAPLGNAVLIQAPEEATLSWPALRGKAVVVEFWATWCGPCIARIPHWNAMVSRFAGRDIRFISLSDEEEETVRSFLARRPISGWVAVDPAGGALRVFGIDSVPRTLLVDPDGVVRAVTHPDAVTPEVIEDLLAGNPLELSQEGARADSRVRSYAAPRLVSPRPDAEVNYQVRFLWSGVYGAAAYNIQVSRTEAFASPLVRNLHVDDPTYESEILLIEPLWWRVRMIDTAGRPGPWSTVRRLRIFPPPLAPSVFSLTVAPDRVAGGEASRGLVTLVEPAPPGGAVVRLAGAEGVTVPRQVLFPEGRSTAYFTIETSPVTEERQVNIAAQARYRTHSAGLWVMPPRPEAILAAFVVQPSLLTAGGSALGMLTLARPAPFRLTVELSSDDPRVQLPPSVSVARGGFGAEFPVRVRHDNSPATVTLSASANGVTKTAVLRLRGAATMAPLPAPEMLEPAAGSTFSAGVAVRFAWTGVSGAASYTFEVDDSPVFDSPIARTLPGPRLELASLPAGPCWWRVRANDQAGAPGPWSRVRAVTIWSPPDPLRYPVGGRSH